MKNSSWSIDMMLLGSPTSSALQLRTKERPCPMMPVVDNFATVGIRFAGDKERKVM